MWRSVIDWVLADVYVIDESPFLVNPTSFPTRDGEERGATDLLQAVATILAEHDQLISRTRELESQTGDPEETLRMVKNLVPVLDGIERVLAFARQSRPSEELTNWLRSVEVVYYRLLNTLERVGLETVATLGKPVDLNCQEVVEYMPSKEHGHDHVVSERQKGYRFRGKLIRDAKVVVAYNPKGTGR